MGDTEFRVRKGSIEDARADAIAVAVAKDAKRPEGDAATLDAALDGALTRLLAAGDFTGAFKEHRTLYPANGAAKRVLVIGLGDADALTTDRVRQLGAKLAKTARDGDARTLALPLIGAGVNGVTAEDAARALAEGALLALYGFSRFKTDHAKKKEPKERLERITLVSPDAPAGVKKAANAGAVVARATNRARDWATVSGDAALAAGLAKEAQAMAREVGLTCTVMDEKRLAKEGFGGVLAVNRGSPHPPRFVILEHGKTHRAKGTLVLVGKGVTFDSGGISIKGAEKMEDMKFDKAGAAAVWGAMQAIAELDLPVHVVGLTPLVENLPSGTALKPGDVYTAFDGSTVEVINTDAEGRMILADALAYADRYDPDAMIDVATLTGHVVVAFGHHVSGIMGNDDALLATLQASAERVHEPVHTFPFLEPYAKLLESDVADLKNHGGRPGGAITAGKFLEHFVPSGVPWAHYDIAGTAWHGGKPQYNAEYSPGQATGVCVRTFVDLAEHWSLGGKKKRAARSTKKTSAKKTTRKSGKKTSRKKTTKR